MKKITLLVLILFAISSINAQILIDEGFDDITTLTDYLIVNVSDSPNLDIFQGDPTVFPAFDGDDSSYLSVNFNATSGNTIDLYMISPELTLKNGDIISFYTRTTVSSTFPDRLEVRLDPDGTGSTPTSSDNGSYTDLLLEINPNIEVGGYPEDWELQTITISGLSEEVTTRFALRYWVTDAGPTGNNSNFIAIDRLVVDSEVLSTDEFSTINFTHFYNSINNELQLNANLVMQNIKVFNTLGQEIVNKKLSSTEETINISNLSQGVYIAQISIENSIETFKFIKN